MMGQEAIDDAADKIKLDNADFQWDAQSKSLKMYLTLQEHKMLPQRII